MILLSALWSESVENPRKSTRRSRSSQDILQSQVLIPQMCLPTKATKLKMMLSSDRFAMSDK